MERGNYLGLDVSAHGAKARSIDLQARLRKAAHSTFDREGNHASGKQLYLEIRKYLIRASDQRLLREGQEAIHQNLLFKGPDHERICEIAVGTVRNFNRIKHLPHFTRRDGGWFDFQLLVKEHANKIEILAYDFELRMSEGFNFEFVRFDLNPNDERERVQKDGLRSHMHLNSDDDGLAVPAPVLSPFEILDLFLHGLQKTGRIRSKPDDSSEPAK